MDKKEFLERLTIALAGQVPETVIAENVDYYDSYISGELAKGSSLKEVLDSLGDPRLIAKSIIEANGGGSDMAGVYEDSDSGQTVGYEPKEERRERYYEDREPTFKSFHFNGFWAALILIVVFALVIWIVGGIFALLSPILLPLLVILMIYWIFRGPRRY